MLDEEVSCRIITSVLHYAAAAAAADETSASVTSTAGQEVEVCTGMGILMRMGFPWEYHGNGRSFWSTNVMGMIMTLEWEWHIVCV